MDDKRVADNTNSPNHASITLHPDQPIGPVAPVHGVNVGGVDYNYWFDLSEWYRRWQIPNVRLHDAPFNAHNTVDLHHVFPNPQADPDDPANYEFRLTDDYLELIRSTGAEIYFRLGESIEHQPRLLWNDPDRWPSDEHLARVCANVLRHYNHGWADGHEWGIRYWEFWNEPHGPKNWNNTPERFFAIYRVVAGALKDVDPAVKVGLAGLAASIGADDPGNHRPWQDGVRALAADEQPLDFLSWHQYATSWTDIAHRAVEVRGFLDTLGLTDTESHLGEWAYRPIADGQDIFRAYKARRYDLVRKFDTRMKSSQGLALILGTFIALQDLPVDLAQYYKGCTSSRFGLFDQTGLLNQRGLAFEIFTEFLRRGPGADRLEVTSDHNDVTALATLERDGRIRLAVAVLNEALTEVTVTIPHSSWDLDRISVHDETGALAVLPPRAEFTDGEFTTLTIPICGSGAITAELALAREPHARIAHPDSAAIAGNQASSGDW